MWIYRIKYKKLCKFWTKNKVKANKKYYKHKIIINKCKKLNLKLNKKYKDKNNTTDKE